MTCASRFVYVAAAAIVLCWASVDAQSLFGFPGHRIGGFDDDFGFGGSSFGRQDDAYHPRAYHRPACPQYKPMQISEWQLVRSASGDGHKIQIILPQVRAQDRRTQLSSDGRYLEILGLRPVPVRGRFRAPECLPQDAQVSRDGQHEILEASVPLPHGADVGRATVRQYGTQGVEVLVPGRPTRAQVEQPTVSRPSTLVTARSAEHAKRLRRPAVPTLPARPKVVLPSSDGVAVVDEDFPYPEKKSDASSGWMDNRGEFQSY